MFRAGPGESSGGAGAARHRGALHPHDRDRRRAALRRAGPGGERSARARSEVPSAVREALRGAGPRHQRGGGALCRRGAERRLPGGRTRVPRPHRRLDARRIASGHGGRRGASRRTPGERPGARGRFSRFGSVKRVTLPEAVLRETRAQRCAGAKIGFVPTMGYLHEGHLALVRRARAECDYVVVSIFVNPLQFGPSEDFDAYPRDLVRDRKLLRSESVDLIYEPTAEALYPPDFSTHVEVGSLDANLCGPRRPGHFRGVATVVCKLLHAVDPDRLYLGQKDFQQAAILTRMIRDLDLPARVVLVP